MNYSKIYSQEVISYAKELFNTQSDEALKDASKNGTISNEEAVMDNLWRIDDEGGIGVSDTMYDDMLYCAGMQLTN